MREFIDKTRLMQRIHMGMTLIEAMQEIIDAPAAEVVERKPGVWIWDDEGYHCSECFFHTYGIHVEILSGDYHFCPHCGATMQGGGQDDV